jgi:hypothetical protein
MKFKGTGPDYPSFPNVPITPAGQPLTREVAQNHVLLGGRVEATNGDVGYAFLETEIDFELAETLWPNVRYYMAR